MDRRSSSILQEVQDPSSQFRIADDDWLLTSKSNDLIRQLCMEVAKLPDETESGKAVVSVKHIANLKSLAQALSKREEEKDESESVESYYSASDFNRTPERPVKRIKLDQSINSSSTRRTPGTPFTTGECILILKTVLQYLDEEDFTCKEVVDLIRNKYWAKPKGNSLQSQYNSKTVVKRNGESLKTKFKSLLQNDAELKDLLVDSQSVKKFQRLRKYYDAVVSFRKKRYRKRANI